MQLRIRTKRQLRIRPRSNHEQTMRRHSRPLDLVRGLDRVQSACMVDERTQYLAPLPYHRALLLRESSLAREARSADVHHKRQFVPAPDNASRLWRLRAHTSSLVPSGHALVLGPQAPTCMVRPSFPHPAPLPLLTYPLSTLAQRREAEGARRAYPQPSARVPRPPISR